MKIIFLNLLLVIGLPALAQFPDTDIFLADITNDHGKISFSVPVNITNRPGYDNQPCFTPDGKSLLFVSIMDTVQSDVYRYDLLTKKKTQVTHTKESEYSPSYSPDGKSISVVRVDQDKGQRFYTMPVNAVTMAQPIKNTDSIGYYCRLNDSLLAMFILGNTFTLEVLNIRTTERKLIASDVGRCMQLSPDKKQLLFVIKQNKSEWGIFSMDIQSLTRTRIISTLKDNEDYTIMPDGTLLMGSEGKLFKFKPGTDSTWQLVADFSSTLKSFYRIAVNSKGDRIAFVAYTGKKP